MFTSILLNLLVSLTLFAVVIILAIVLTRKKPLEETTILDEPQEVEFFDQIPMIKNEKKMLNLRKV